MLTDDKLKEAIAFNDRRNLPETLGREEFARLVYAGQANAELDTDGKYGAESRAEWGGGVPEQGDLDYAKIFAGGVHPMPIYGGVKPQLTSGFIAKSGRGPNKHRLKHTGRPHYGGDLGYWWNGKGEPPLGWMDYHFTALNERLFYCPPVPVRSMLAGKVELAEILPVSETWGGPRWAIRIYHGELEGFGHFSTWSTHHRELLVSVDDVVAAGETIAIAGETGSPGAPHNHQEIWRWQTGEQFTRESGAQDLAPILPHLELRAA